MIVLIYNFLLISNFSKPTEDLFGDADDISDDEKETEVEKQKPEDEEQRMEEDETSKPPPVSVMN